MNPRAIAPLLAALFAAALLTGCAATECSSCKKSGPGPHAECGVCKHNADLACVDIHLDADTPRTTYQGKTYYFCSDSCKEDFVKDPAKYLGAAR